MAGGRRTHDAILANEQLLDPICSSNLRNHLCDFRVPVSSITANDQKAALRALGDGFDGAGYEGLAIVLLLEDLDLLAKSGAIQAQRQPSILLLNEEWRESILKRLAVERVCVNHKAICKRDNLRSRLLVGEWLQ